MTSHAYFLRGEVACMVSDSGNPSEIIFPVSRMESISRSQDFSQRHLASQGIKKDKRNCECSG